MSKFKFIKKNVLGNDYVVIDCLKNDIKTEDILTISSDICDRWFGIGADDIILIRNSEIADFKIEIINPDGSFAPMCGNGVISAANHIIENNLVSDNKFTIETMSGVRDIEYMSETCEIKEKLGKPIIDSNDPEKIIDFKGEKIKIIPINTGTYHVVVYVDDLENYRVNEVGDYIEHHEMFPETTNVMFVKKVNNEVINMRCWERGGTGESLACGTGACAASYVTYLKYGCNRKFLVNFTKGNAKVEIDREGNVYLITKASTAFKGEYLK